MLLLLKIIVNFYQRSNESLNELIQIVIGCITDTKAIEEQPKMEMTFYYFLYTRCIDECKKKENESLCNKDCHDD